MDFGATGCALKQLAVSLLFFAYFQVGFSEAKDFRDFRIFSGKPNIKTSPSEFVDQLKIDSLLHARAQYDEILGCLTLVPEISSSSLLRSELKQVQGQELVVNVQALNVRDLSYLQIARTSQALDRLHSKWGYVCGDRASWRNGIHPFHSEIEKLTAGLYQRRFLFSAALRIIFNIPTQVKGYVLSTTAEMLAPKYQKILDIEDTTRGRTFLKYVAILTENPTVQDLLRSGVNQPLGDLTSFAQHYLSPYFVSYSGRMRDNMVLPFIQEMKSNFYSQQQFRQCFQNLEKGRPPVSNSNAPGENYRLLFGYVASRCPNLEPLAVRAILASSDRLYMSLLPISARLELEKRLAAQSFVGTESDLEHVLFADYSAMENFTEFVANQLRFSRFHHFATGAFLSCLLARHIPERSIVRTLIGLNALGYQVLDATGDHLRQEDYNLSAMVEDSVGDIQTWLDGHEACALSMQ